MIEVTEKAEKYAVGKTIDTIDKAIAQAYADGYRDGYKDREEEIPVDLRDNKTEYVDLGLPSGTLWSTDYEKEGNEIIYIPYDKATTLNIPNLEQWKELFNCCELKVENGVYYFVGPNGKYVEFFTTGYKEIDKESSLKFSGVCYFWCKADNEYNAGSIGYHQGPWKHPSHLFTGFKLPVRLVLTKK